MNTRSSRAWALSTELVLPLIFVGCTQEIGSSEGERPEPMSAESTASSWQRLVTTSALVVNECGSGSSGFVELVNAGSMALDLARDPNNCWYVDDTNGGGSPKLINDSNVNHAASSTTCANASKSATCAIVGAGEHVWVPYSYINWASPDECRLLASTRSASACGSDFASIGSVGTTSSSVAGQCFGRLPDLGSWSSATITCTIGGANPCQAGTSCDDGNACTSGEVLDSSCQCGSGVPLSGTACGTNQVCEAGACVELPPPAGPVLSHLGRRDRLLLSGTVITFDSAIEGQVLVEGNTITCVAEGTACSGAPGATDATVIDTAGIIAPGLIDTHNHVLFDVFDESDWTPTMTYQNHNQWPNEPRYQAMLDVKQCLSNDSQGKPAWCANTPYGTSAGSLRCELDKYGELKGLVAGTTSMVGLPGTSSACFGSLARSIDVAQNGLGEDKVQTSSLFPPSKTSADNVCENFASGKTDAYLIHDGEGVDAASLTEFATLGTLTSSDYCLYAPQTTITHGVAFTQNEFAIMAGAGMKLTWSPASNLFLHGQTADIPAALAAGVRVALAPDWSIGGSQNLLDEMRFADAWDNAHWSNRLSPKDLLDMATSNGAEVLALQNRLGRIAPGYLADIAVFAGDRADPYAAVLAARPKDVSLVVVGGSALYGDLALSAAGAPEPGCETLDICGSQKFLCVASASSASKLGQTYAEIRSALAQAMLDVDAQTPGDGYDFAPLTPLVRCDR
ncbi:MAG TPA: amidohydrolase family protein [Polyangiaceae bacterium]|nr:amidohydrolase family protein [Polyangiaceae bacterium]